MGSVVVVVEGAGCVGFGGEVVVVVVVTGSSSGGEEDVGCVASLLREEGEGEVGVGEDIFGGRGRWCFWVGLSWRIWGCGS